MKIKFDAPKLYKQVHLLRMGLHAAKDVAQDDLLEIVAQDKKLSLYGTAQGSWVHMIIPCDVVEAGRIVVPRSRFFKVLATLKGERVLRTLPSAPRIEISGKSAGKMLLATSTALMGHAHLPESTPTVRCKPKRIRDQLRLTLLDGDLIGGGYRISRERNELVVTASDRQRLIVTRQRLDPEEIPELTIHAQAIRGVFEIMDLAEEHVHVKVGHNLTSIAALLESGVKMEYGYPNTVEVFPDVGKITSLSGYPNSGRFEVGGLLEAMQQAASLADEDLPFAELSFVTPETCNLEAFNRIGAAELQLDCPSQITEESTSTIRLQLSHIKSLLSKAKECGSTWVVCQWGKGFPVRWTFDFDEAEDKKFNDIEMVFIAPPLNDQATPTRRKE